MPDEKVTQIPDSKIAELKRLHAAATKGKLRAVGHRLSHEANRQIDQTVFHMDEIGQIGTGPYQAIPFARREDAEWHAALHNEFSSLLARLEELRETVRAHEDSIETLGAMNRYLKQERKDRDAQQRREGAIEELTEIANDRFTGGLFLPDRTHYTMAEVREILLEAAKRLREWGE